MNLKTTIFGIEFDWAAPLFIGGCVFFTSYIILGFPVVCGVFGWVWGILYFVPWVLLAAGHKDIKKKLEELGIVKFV